MYSRPILLDDTLADDWASVELQGIDLRDSRLTDRAVDLLQTLANHPTLSIPAACATAAKTKGAYRFLDHKRVTFSTVLAPHRACTHTRAQAEDTVLCLADITEFNYTNKTVAAELGYIGDNKTRGLFGVPILAVTPDRVPLGLVDCQYWLRAECTRPAAARKHWPIEQKETFCWLRAYRTVCQWQATLPTTTCVYITDRGGDIYEIYAEVSVQPEAARAAFVIRGDGYDRCLLDATPAGEPQAAHLRAQVLAEATVKFPVQFELPATPDRPARVVVQQGYAATVWLKAPYRKGRPLPDVAVNVVLLVEENPPSGISPLVWLLYTSLPVTTEAEALRVVAYYLGRWEIELYFKVLKSGCAVEELYLQTAERLLPCLALYLIAAWRLLYTVRVGRACPDMPCTLVFTEAEWKAMRLIYDPEADLTTAPTMSEMVTMVAQSGGYVGAVKERWPGIKTMWVGMQCLHDYALAYHQFGMATRRRKEYPRTC